MAEVTAPESGNDGRPSWDAYGLGLADAVAQRADCSRRTVGAVLMRPDHTIVSTGYNGAPSGAGSCLRGDCLRGRSTPEELPGHVAGTSYDVGAGACIAVHAEQNALLRASWDEMEGATLYVTCQPCPTCIRLITGTHIQRVMWRVESQRDVLSAKSALVRNGRWIEDRWPVSW